MDNTEIDIRVSALTDMVECFESAGAPSFTLDSKMTHAVMCRSVRTCIKILEDKRVKYES